MSQKSLKVEIDATKVKCYLTVGLHEGVKEEGAPPLPPTVSEILAELQNQGVVFGILQSTIETLVLEQRWGKKTLVAEGVSPLPGEEGRLEHLFENSATPKPQENNDGTVNLRDIGLIHIVQEGETLSRILPPRPGVPGTTVLGQAIPAKLGREANLIAGKNTGYRAGNQRELVALTTGSVSVVNGAVQVENTFVVHEDVDFSTGNIDFPGDVMIQGDVKCGFTVRAGGKIEICGVVEEAHVIAGGDVLVKGGFEGTGRGSIKAGGNVQVKFIENQTLEAAGSVFVAQSALNSKITAGKGIKVNNGVGVVRGGHLSTPGWIIVKVAGNTNNTPTVLEIIQEVTIHPELEKKDLEVTMQQLEMARTRLELSLLQKKKPAGKDERKQVEIEKVKLCDRLESLRVNLEAATKELHRFKAGLPEARLTGRVQILQKGYPGVKIIIGNLKYLLKDDHHRALLKKCGMEIAVLSAEETAHEDITW